MGMSTHLVLLRDPDNKEHRVNVAAVKALKAAGIYELPNKLAEYFDVDEVSEVDDKGCLELESCFVTSNNMPIGVYKLEKNHREGFEIHIKDLPEGVDIIKVYNAY